VLCANFTATRVGKALNRRSRAYLKVNYSRKTPVNRLQCGACLACEADVEQKIRSRTSPGQCCALTSTDGRVGEYLDRIDAWRCKRKSLISLPSFAHHGLASEATLHGRQPLTNHLPWVSAGPRSSSRGTVGLVLCADWALRWVCSHWSIKSDILGSSLRMISQTYT
jgi:hypothetical protein